MKIQMKILKEAKKKNLNNPDVMYSLVKKKRIFATLTAFVASIFVLSGIQGSLISVSAQIIPVTVSIDHLDFGTAFPGESLSGDFVVSIAEEQEEDISYRIVQKRKPLPLGHPEYPDGGDPELPGFYRNLCPYLTKVSNEGEGDSENNALVGPDDQSDEWVVLFEVPAIIGGVAQDHTGGIVDSNKEYGCDISIDVFENNTSICGYKFNDLNENGIQDEDEPGLSDWTILLQQFIEGDFETVETTVTDFDGYYCFQRPVDHGEYRVQELQQEDWRAVTDEFQDVVIEEDSNLLIYFGNIEEDQTPSTPPGPTGGGGGGGGGGFSGLIIHTETNDEIGTQTATISWHTNKPATSRVLYDTVSHPIVTGAPPNYNYAFSTAEDTTKVTFHTVVITDLTPDTIYYWRPISAASPEIFGQEITFTTEINGAGGPNETEPEEPPVQILDQEEEGISIIVDDNTVSGIVLGEAFEETPDIVIDDQEEGEVIIIGENEATSTATTTPVILDTESCEQTLWFLLIVNIAIALVIIKIDKKSKLAPIKDVWLYYLLLVLVPIIIGYPNCNLVWWLIITAILGIIYIIWRRQENMKRDAIKELDHDDVSGKYGEQLAFGPKEPSKPGSAPDQESPRRDEDDISKLFPPIES